MPWFCFGFVRSYGFGFDFAGFGFAPVNTLTLLALVPFGFVLYLLTLAMLNYHAHSSVPFSTCVLCFLSLHMMCLVYADIYICYAHLYAMLCSFLQLLYVQMPCSLLCSFLHFAVLCFLSPYMLCLVYADIHICYAHLYAIHICFLHMLCFKSSFLYSEVYCLVFVTDSSRHCCHCSDGTQLQKTGSLERPVI